jgi:hypothetical protein
MQNELEQIHTLLEEGKARQALEALDALPATGEKGHIVRQRLRISALDSLAMLEQAFSVRESVAHSPLAELDDLHDAGVEAVRLRYYDKALAYLTRTIDLSVAENEPYYLSVCYSLRAYVQAQNGDLAAAMQDLAQLEDDFELGWIPDVPKLTRDYVISLARNRAREMPR